MTEIDDYLEFPGREKFLEKYKNPKRKVKIGLVGKYVELQDSYKSILEAIIHAGAINEAEVEVVIVHQVLVLEEVVPVDISPDQ